MANLLGIIVPLRKFLSKTQEKISVSAGNQSNDVLILEKDREYIIPDFQREIRWDSDNLDQLIDDLCQGPKYLGNVILTQGKDNKFFIIDGQQRITVLTMIITCIKYLHSGETEVITPCNLSIESFGGFEEVINNNFEEYLLQDEQIRNSDRLHQVEKYYQLWSEMINNSRIRDRYNVKYFLENLKSSEINIIVNKSDDTKEGIRYFIDVNLKGKQLDTEDIFKGYLFQNDSGDEIRAEWYKFKTKISEVNKSKMDYPLLKILEHYFYCDLYNDKQFRGMDFDEKFMLRSEFKLNGSYSRTFRVRTHVIEVINNNMYMRKSIKTINKMLDIMLNIVKNETINDDFRQLFKYYKAEKSKIKTVDNTELKVIHNFISKILKDDNVLPKALIMKYILTVLIDKEAKEKNYYEQIYGVYMLAVLFTLFENNKSKTVLIGILKSPNINWYKQIITQIDTYFTIDKITDNKLLAQFKLGKNEEEFDYKFRCKSVATVFNYFKLCDQKVIISGDFEELKAFVTDENKFSLEHFIISNNDAKRMEVIFEEGSEEYKFQKNSIYNKMVKSIFNFIFINSELNSTLGNYWLPKKREIIDKNIDQIQCSYSKMVIEKTKKLSESMEAAVSRENYKDDLDLYFGRDFRELYIIYARNILDEVIEKIKTN